MQGTALILKRVSGRPRAEGSILNAQGEKQREGWKKASKDRYGPFAKLTGAVVSKANEALETSAKPNDGTCVEDPELTEAVALALDGSKDTRGTHHLTTEYNSGRLIRVNHLSNNWGDKVENCKLPFYKLYRLLKDPDVKADIAKVRGARGPDYVYKAESLAVELSGSSDDDN